ncbi:unnamed protein product, partial [Mesorhabditis spiculigera]
MPNGQPYLGPYHEEHQAWPVPGTSSATPQISGQQPHVAPSEYRHANVMVGQPAMVGQSYDQPTYINLQPMSTQPNYNHRAGINAMSGMLHRNYGDQRAPPVDGQISYQYGPPGSEQYPAANYGGAASARGLPPMEYGPPAQQQQSYHPPGNPSQAATRNAVVSQQPMQCVMSSISAPEQFYNIGPVQPPTWQPNVGALRENGLCPPQQASHQLALEPLKVQQVEAVNRPSLKRPRNSGQRYSIANDVQRPTTLTQPTMRDAVVSQESIEPFHKFFGFRYNIPPLEASHLEKRPTGSPAKYFTTFADFDKVEVRKRILFHLKNYGAKPRDGFWPRALHLLRGEDSTAASKKKSKETILDPAKEGLRKLLAVVDKVSKATDPTLVECQKILVTYPQIRTLAETKTPAQRGRKTRSDPPK